MDLKIDRLLAFSTGTLGSLYVDGVWECFTKEPPVRPDNVFVAGESALPAGMYTVSIPASKQYGRNVPLLVSSQLLGAGGHRVAIGMRFLPGHYTLDNASAGILVGKTQGPRDVHHTRQAYEDLVAKLEQSRRCGQAIELEIA